MAFDADMNVLEEQFSNKVAAFEKAAAADAVSRVLCSESADSVSSSQLSNVDDQGASYRGKVGGVTAVGSTSSSSK